MSLPEVLQGLRLPVIGSPMFIVSRPELVIAQCKAGIVGSFPALNARPASVLEDWLKQITTELDAYKRANPGAKVAPFAVNQIVHKSNDRLMHDLELCVKYKVPIVITSLGAREDVNQAVHSYGGIVLHDIINVTFAKKALEKGADGLIAVCTGAGGHAGIYSPFALVQEVRAFFDGPLVLATSEANAVDDYKRMIVEGSASDILYTNSFSGVNGNYLIPSIVRAGMDPAALPASDPSKMDFGTKDAPNGPGPKAWKDIWGCGQGIGAVQEVAPVAAFVDRLEREYQAARSALLG
jgi:nitronate monooxygenase